MIIRLTTMVAACLTVTPLQAQAPPDALGERVRRDLGSIFQPGATLESSPNVVDNRLASGHLQTRPYATSIAGICRRDEVILDYAGPVPAAETAAGNAAEPFGVSAQSWYRVIRAPPFAINRERPFEGACSRLDGAETVGWFVASDVFVAAEGYRAFAAMLRQLADPHHRISGCRESAESRQSCLTMFPASALDRILAIGRCESAQYHFCFTFRLADDSDVTIRLRYDSQGNERIERIAIEYPPIMV